MKKFVFTICAIVLVWSVRAQTISEIKNESQRIEGRMSNEKYEHDAEQFKEIRSILTLNVFAYYHLDEIYNSELKRKVFKASEDYKSKMLELQNKKAQLKKDLYYLDFEPTYYERNNLIKYNLSAKTFAVTNQVYADELYNKPNVIQFDQLVFKCPIGIAISKKLLKMGGVDFVEQSIKFKIVDESLALKIEENRSNIKLLFVFKFAEAVPYLGLDFIGRQTTLYALLNTPVKVIVYNDETNEEYFTYNHFEVPKAIPKK